MTAIQMKCRHRSRQLAGQFKQMAAIISRCVHWNTLLLSRSTSFIHSRKHLSGSPTRRNVMADAASKITKVVVNKPAEFDETIKELSGDVFVLMYGERKENGDSWCPDCTAALPVIVSALEARAGPSTLVECTVAREEYKGKPEYAYRTHERVALKAIPQLIKWSAEGSAPPSLVEEDAGNAEKVAQLVQ